MTRHLDGTVLDCTYDGHDIVYIHGHVDEATAAQAAEEFVLAERKQRAGPWWVEIDTLTVDERVRDLQSEGAPLGYAHRCRRCGDTRPTEHLCVGFGMWAPHRPDVCPACGADCGEEVARPRYGFGAHMRAHYWARWGFPSYGSDHDRVLYFYSSSRRGAFKLTLVRDLDTEPA